MPGRGPHSRRPAVPTGPCTGGGPNPARHIPGAVPGLHHSTTRGRARAGAPASAAPPSLLAALNAFFLMEEAPQGEQPDGGDGAEPQADDQYLGPALDIDEDDK